MKKKKKKKKKRKVESESFLHYYVKKTASFVQSDLHDLQ